MKSVCQVALWKWFSMTHIGNLHSMHCFEPQKRELIRKHFLIKKCQKPSHVSLPLGTRFNAMTESSETIFVFFRLLGQCTTCIKYHFTSGELHAVQLFYFEWRSMKKWKRLGDALRCHLRGKGWLNSGNSHRGPHYRLFRHGNAWFLLPHWIQVPKHVATGRN